MPDIHICGKSHIHIIDPCDDELMTENNVNITDENDNELLV